MAFEVQKIDPLDLQPRKAVGVKLPFSSPSVFTLTYQTKDAIKTNLINYFLTGKGERYLNLDFGNSLQPLLFEQLTQEKIVQIRNEVRRDLQRYFPRVQPIEFNVEGDPDNNVVQFLLTYRVIDTNIEDELVLNFEQ
jgi:phage baseplate assembly protein W